MCASQSPPSQRPTLRLTPGAVHPHAGADVRFVSGKCGPVHGGGAGAEQCLLLRAMWGAAPGKPQGTVFPGRTHSSGSALCPSQAQRPMGGGAPASHRLQLWGGWKMPERPAGCMQGRDARRGDQGVAPVWWPRRFWLEAQQLQFQTPASLFCPARCPESRACPPPPPTAVGLCLQHQVHEAGLPACPVA